MKTGLVSVTFRKLQPEEIIRLAAESALDAIEWGGDIHVPCGDTDTARRVGEMTRRAGLSVACYGSYLRLTDGEDPLPAVRTAQALGAPLLRVWAGKKGSAEASEQDRAQSVRNARVCADAARACGIDVAFEYHGGTLTDSSASCLKLLREADRANLFTLWQPPVGMSTEDCVRGIRAAAPFIRNIHVFSWREHERLPLREGREKWAACLREIRALPGERCLLLEFVAGDDPACFSADARTLKQWLREAENTEER